MKKTFFCKFLMHQPELFGRCFLARNNSYECCGNKYQNRTYYDHSHIALCTGLNDLVVFERKLNSCTCCISGNSGVGIKHQSNIIIGGYSALRAGSAVLCDRKGGINNIGGSLCLINDALLYGNLCFTEAGCG